MIFIGVSHATAAPFPSRPVKIVVYTKPGGLIDITARKIAQILESRYLSQPVVVENKKGAGGIVALTHLTRQPADGHTALALTSSVISKLVSAKQERRLEQLYLLARLVDDYECLIVNRKSAVSDVKQIIADAQKRTGAQIWSGPASGGTDHLFAMKFWKAAGINAKWIPYRSGGEAVASLLGNHSTVYVGNPQDVRGRSDLKIAAVSSAEPLESFPDTPTFRSLGFDSLTGESLWRGLALRKGTAPEVTAVWEAALIKLSQDPEWLSFVKEGSAQPIYDRHDTFTKLVQTQLESDRRLLHPGVTNAG